MSGARPIKMSYTPDQVMFAGFSDSTILNNIISGAVCQRQRKETWSMNSGQAV